MHIQPFDAMTATDAEWTAMHVFNDRFHAEANPEDPHPPHSNTVRQWQAVPASMQAHRWAAWQDGVVIGRAATWIRYAEDNQHAADFHLVVLPEWRRQGIGQQLLAEVVGVAQQAGRTLLVSWTTDTVPDGEGFLVHIGAHRALEIHENQLLMADLDLDLMRRWQADAKRRAPEYRLDFVDGVYAEEDLEAVAKAIQSINDAPRGELAIEDEVVTPQTIREREAVFDQRGVQRWIMLARNTKTGAIAGWTEVHWNLSQPDLLQQQGTGVLAQYRGLGLGRWLKAAMALKVVQDRPQVTKIRTGNADSNAPMLKINYEMGFKPYQSSAVWQIETAQAVSYLERHA